MDEFDFFELTGLPFDPPEKSAKKVKDAIEKTRGSLNVLLGSATQQIERDSINSKLSFLTQKDKELFDGGGKLTPKYEELARERTEVVVKSINAAISLFKESGMRIFTKSAIRRQSKKYHLSTHNVEKAYRDAGFTVSEVDPLAAFPKFPTHADRIRSDLEALRKAKDPNHQGKDRTSVVDLYAFAAYLCGEPENAAEYRNMTTSALASLFDEYSKRLSMRNDDLGKLCASLASAGKTYVFNSEDNRRAYEAFLLFYSPVLMKLFNKIAQLTKTDLSNPRIADSCIKQISEVFGNYEIALAIYNKIAGLEDEPYEPDKPIFYVKCAHCLYLNDFADINEAHSTNKCKNISCGNPLYKKCKNCSKSVLEGLDKCPECGFVFASAAQFIKYYSLAERELHRSNFEEARKYLLQARNADPSQKNMADQLEARISADEIKYKQPINNLRKIIAEGMFHKAREVLADTIGKYPDLNVAEFEKQINSAIAEAENKFRAAEKQTASKKADVCLEILQACKDFKPANDFLLATPPESCKNFTIGLDENACKASPSWARSAEKGITYRLVRKKGNDIPHNESDGEILADGKTDTSFRDDHIVPGCYYSYAAFAVRHGVFSSPAGKTVVLLANVTNIRYDQSDTTIYLTWDKPKNCTGVTIYRTAEGKTATIVRDANGSYEDKGVKHGVTYIYKFCANYNGFNQSNGAEIVITSTLRIGSFSIQAKQLSGNQYQVSWDIKHSGIDLRILVDGKQIREIKSDARQCDITLPPDGFRTITVSAFSGGQWLESSNKLQINTYSPCSVDKEASAALFREYGNPGAQHSAQRIELYIIITKPIPGNAVGFYYTVRTKSASDKKAPWVNKDELVSAADIQRVNIATYQRDGKIIHTAMARDEESYYISLFTIYNFNGTEVVSDPFMWRFDRPLEANLFWEVEKITFGNLKLTIGVSANRPMYRIPELVLCACPDGQQLLSAIDTRGRTIQTFPGVKFESPKKTFEYTYEIGNNVSTRQLKGKKLFLFEASAAPGEKFALRWKSGFNGKV